MNMLAPHANMPHATIQPATIAAATAPSPATPTAATFDARPEKFLAHLSLIKVLRALITHRQLAYAISKREIEAKYRTHRLGIAWVIFTPLVLLGVYTFVFGIVFKTSITHNPSEPLGNYALSIFTGLLTFGIFRDMATRAPMVIVAHKHFVTKMVFPLEALALSELFTALFNFFVGMVVWCIGYGIIIRELPTWHAMLAPILLIPVCFAGLGVSWLLSSLGAFLRDLSSMIELLVVVLFHMTPIFYNIDRIPEPWRTILMYNPLAHIVQGVRAVLLEHRQPDWPWFLAASAASLAIAVIGYAFFIKSKRAFADVL